MKIIDALKFVKGAVAKKDPVAVLTHFSIRGGYVKGFNGLVTLCSPIPLDLDCQPLAIPFTKAIEASEDTAQLSMTASGRLTVKSGSFKAHIDCSPDAFPDTIPAGDMFDLQPGLVAALKVLEPMIAEDASKDWARSILIQNGCLFATNNVLIAQYWAGIQTPYAICISHAAVNELIRIKRDPIKIQSDGTSSVTFHYEDGQWLRTQLITTQWPDTNKIFAQQQTMSPIPPGFFDALEKLSPFANKERDVFFVEGGVTTSRDGTSGASQQIDGWNPVRSWHNLDMWRLVKDVAEIAAFDSYPAPVQFFGLHNGENYLLRGAIAGRKDGNPV